MAQGRKDVRRGWPVQRVGYRPRPPPLRPPLPLSCRGELAPAKEERSTSPGRRSTAGERLPLAASMPGAMISRGEALPVAP